MNREKAYEPWIVLQDDNRGNCDIMYWAETEEDALSYYKEVTDEYQYPTDNDRNLHMFRLIKSTDPVYIKNLSSEQTKIEEDQK